MPRLKLQPPPKSARITDQAELARVIRHMRMKAGLTMDEAAMSIGIAKATLLRAEQGKEGVQLDTVLKILDGLGISLYVLPKTHDRFGDLQWPKS